MHVLAAGGALVALVATGAQTNHPHGAETPCWSAFLLADTASDTTQQDEDAAEEWHAQQALLDEQEAQLAVPGK